MSIPAGGAAMCNGDRAGAYQEHVDSVAATAKNKLLKLWQLGEALYTHHTGNRTIVMTQMHGQNATEAHIIQRLLQVQISPNWSKLVVRAEDGYSKLVARAVRV